MGGDGEGRTVVVTGGTGGLGRGVVSTLLERGWRVRVPWHSEEGADELRDATGDPDALELGPADVTDPDDFGAFLEGVSVYGLCNLVGGFATGGLTGTDPGTWERMMRLNARSAFVASRAAVPRMREAHGGGRIINVASFPAVERGSGEMVAYAASKAAVVSLTHSLSKELRGEGIPVNAVAPEVIDTPANRRAMPDADRSSWLEPAEIGRVIAFLLSGAGAVVTGSVLMLAKG